MPEMPEVETIRRIIEPQVADRTIQSVEVLHPQVIAHPDSSTFACRLVDQTIVGMGRRGKFLMFKLGSGDKLVLHLRMTGQLLVTPADYPKEKHTHVIMVLSDGREIRYIDQRRFGRFWLIEANESDAAVGMDRLGFEALDDALAGGYLRERLGKRKKTSKEALLDQSIVAGIGNIYADEILWVARIHPEKPCNKLSAQAWNKLAAAIKDVIAWGIETNEMTPEEYLAGKGKEYNNIPDLKAYGRDGEPCLRCGRPLKRLTISGRSSYCCPYCQRKS